MNNSLKIISNINGKLTINCSVCDSTWNCDKIYYDKFSFCYTCTKKSIFLNNPNLTYSLDEIRIIGYIKNNLIPIGNLNLFSDITNTPTKLFCTDTYAAEDYETPSYYLPDGFINKNYIWKINKFEIDINSNNLGTVFEILGDYFHSNPLFYEPYDISPRKGLTNIQNYEHTMNRLDHLKHLKYNVFYIWISDFNRFCKNKCSFKDIINKQKVTEKITRNIF